MRRTIAALLLAGSLHAQEPASFANDVDARTQKLQMTKAEQRFEEIGWAKDLLQARKLSKDNNLPLFLFWYDGTSIADARC